jgi:hypothetical protein
LALFRLAFQLAQAGVTRIDGRLSINYKPGFNTMLQPHTLSIIRHSDADRVVLSVVWRDNEPAIIVEYVGGAWSWILKRAAALQPISILPD